MLAHMPEYVCAHSCMHTCTSKVHGASLMFSHAIKFQAASTGATRWQTLLLGRKNRGGAKAFAPSGANGSHTYLPYLKGKKVLQAHHLEWLKACSRDSPRLPRRMSDCEILGNK